MNYNNGKKIIAWIMLFLMIILVLILSYIKFFSVGNPNIEEVPVENSSSNAIHLALEEITKNFNDDPKIDEYSKNNINIKAVVNNYSIYISYVTDTSITYEFTYDDLCLSILVSEENNNTFKEVYAILIKAIQDRINNEENIDELINNFFTTDASYDGLSKSNVDGGIEYKINITKKLSLSEGSEG